VKIGQYLPEDTDKNLWLKFFAHSVCRECYRYKDDDKMFDYSTISDSVSSVLFEVLSASFDEEAHAAVSGTRKSRRKKKPATKKQVSERHRHRHSFHSATSDYNRNNISRDWPMAINEVPAGRKFVTSCSYNSLDVS